MEQKMIEDLQVLNPVANSDHCIIQWNNTVINTKAQNEVRDIFNFHKGQYDKICGELQEVDCGREFKDRDVERMWKVLLARLNRCRDKYVPKSKKEKDILLGRGQMCGRKLQITKREKEWKRFKQRPKMEGEKRYKRLRTSIIKEIRDARGEQEFKLAKR
jgi:hypothetical protein